MRIVRHPNIVELKAFYYSNGERVSTTFVKAGVKNLTVCVEGRSLFEPGFGVCSGDRLPGLTILQQDEDCHAHA